MIFSRPSRAHQGKIAHEVRVLQAKEKLGKAQPRKAHWQGQLGAGARHRFGHKALARDENCVFIMSLLNPLIVPLREHPSYEGRVS